MYGELVGAERFLPLGEGALGSEAVKFCIRDRYP